MLVPLIALLQLASSAGPAPQAGVPESTTEYSGRRGELDVMVPRMDQDVVIDGVLDEAAWAEAAVLTDFSQYRPVDGVAAEDNTEVLVWYSSTAIHFAIKAYEPHGTVRSTLADRDRIANDDHIQILLDTFNDGRTATVFGVNPLGVQSDGSRVERGAQSRGFGGRGTRDPVDLSPDFIYETQGQLTPFGYQIEMRIPFKSVSFQPADIQSWGINVIRRVQHSGREQTWTPAQLGRASFLAQGGTLQDLQDFDRGLVLDLNPVVTSSVDGSPGTSRWDYDASTPEVGGNVRWGITRNLTLNASVNPDFSQVEADASQTQFDPRNAVFFPEKRPFFLEGSENFQTPNRLIYTRRIASPDVAAKITGKVSGTEVAFLSAKDSDLAGDQSSPIFNILRVKRDLGEESTLGVAYTDRVDGANYNRLASADTRLVFGGIYDLQMQGAFSFDRNSGVTQNGHLWDANLRRQGREFGFNVSFKGMSDDLIARSGFLSRVGTVALRGGPSLTRYGNAGSFVEQYQASLVLESNWLHQTFMDGGTPDNWLKSTFGHDFTLRGGWNIGISALIERFYYPPDLYQGLFIEHQTPTGTEFIPFVGEPKLDNYDLVLSFRTPNSPRFSANGFFAFGQDENFDEWSNSYVLLWSSNLVFRPTEQLRAEWSHTRQQYLRKTDRTSVRIRSLPRIKVEYQLTRDIFLRFVGEYDAVKVDALRDDGRTNDPLVRADGNGGYERVLAQTRNNFGFDALFSYEPSPGTVVFAGYGSSLKEERSFRFSGLERRNDGFFVKLSYLFRMK